MFSSNVSYQAGTIKSSPTFDWLFALLIIMY